MELGVKRARPLSLRLQKAQTRSYLHTLSLKVSLINVPGTPSLTRIIMICVGSSYKVPYRGYREPTKIMVLVVDGGVLLVG